MTTAHCSLCAWASLRTPRSSCTRFSRHMPCCHSSFSLWLGHRDIGVSVGQSSPFFAVYDFHDSDPAPIRTDWKQKMDKKWRTHEQAHELLAKKRMTKLRKARKSSVAESQKKKQQAKAAKKAPQQFLRKYFSRKQNSSITLLGKKRSATPQETTHTSSYPLLGSISLCYSIFRQEAPVCKVRSFPNFVRHSRHLRPCCRGFLSRKRTCCDARALLSLTTPCFFANGTTLQRLASPPDVNLRI